MRKAVALLISVLLLTLAIVWWQSDHADAPIIESPKTSTQAANVKQFNKSAYSLKNPASPWVIVNKMNPIVPLTYTPSDLKNPQVALRVSGQAEMQLRKEAASALEKMFEAAETKGLNLQVSTAYRGYDYQKTLYDGYVKDSGQAIADSVSARPGYSEHQTGWAVDIRSVPDRCGLETCFGDMPEGEWLQANAYTYGFHLRYPNGKESVTGYTYEPWHYRYVGTELSNELRDKKVITLEEFFSVQGGTAY